MSECMCMHVFEYASTDAVVLDHVRDEESREANATPLTPLGRGARNHLISKIILDIIGIVVVPDEESREVILSRI